jgi:CubicO group peptidase (beta-lactamase class C family)
VTDRLDRITATLDAAVAANTLAGYVALVHHRDREVYAQAGGLADREANVAMRRDTIIRIASMTKPIAAAAVMTFVEDGTVRLYDPIERWLPELASRRVLRDPAGSPEDTVPSPRPITLHDVMSFQFGIGWTPSVLRDALFGMLAPPLAQALGVPASTDLPPDGWLAKLAEMPLVYAPGERWTYHIAAEVLGVLLARLGDAPLEEVLRARVLDPLGMVDTSFSVPAAKRARLATLYATKDDALVVRDPATHSSWAEPPRFPSAGGGLVSTVDDFQRFARMLANGGELDGVRVLSRAGVAWMTTDHLTAAHKAAPPATMLDPLDVDRGPMWGNRGFGYGLAVRTRRVGIGPAVGSVMWPGAFGTAWVADPREQVVATVLPQVLGANPFFAQHVEDFSTAVYQALD